MRANEEKLLNFLNKSPQFVIPIYQRTYTWTNKECRQLWDDIIRAGTNERISVHFIGSIVSIEGGLSQISHRSPYLVIDGQQRLTTVSLLLAALAEVLGDDEPIDGFSARKLRNYYLLNREETGERHYRLLLSQTDKSTLQAIVKQDELPSEKSLRVMENYELFKSWISSHKRDLTSVCNGLAKLVVVDITLSRDQDNPQLIFESMNSTGRELSHADLIRNFVLMGLEQEPQTRLYQDFWRKMETDFGQEAYDTYFDSFMRHYLTVKTGNIPRLKEIYEAFKNYARTPTIKDAGIEALIKDIRDYARHYCAMALGAEADADLKLAFHDLRELKVDVAYPFLLELYHDYKAGTLQKADFIQAVRLIESYVFRRAICSFPANSLNKTFSTFTKALKKDRYLESIRAHFQLELSYRRFPNDDEFKREFQLRDLYSFRSRSYWLRKFEKHGRKEYVPVDEYTVEHIMPQNENLSTAWKEALGENWENIHQTYLHTLGNLTLTGYNSEYSDRPFNEKRDMEGGFKESPLRLNAGLGALEKWNEHTIKDRAEKLAAQVSGVWAAPNLPEEILETYRPKRNLKTAYSIEDHPWLHSPDVHMLFEAFRKKVLALDPCITEEFMKWYVAYKAETNFVDVIQRLRAKCLLLSLNMRFPEINDPRGLCKDTSGGKTRGNGDVEVRLNSIEDLPYVMGLVSQSLDRQLGNDSDE